MIVAVRSPLQTFRRSAAVLRRTSWSQFRATTAAIKPTEMRGHWTEVRRLATEMLHAGGATIETPPQQAPDQTVFARTVIQADGDVLVLVHRNHVRDGHLQRDHSALVSGWYARSDAAFTSVRVLLNSARRFVAGAIAAVAAVVSTMQWGNIAGLLALLGVSTGANLAIHAVVRQLFRRALGGVLP